MYGSVLLYPFACRKQFTPSEAVAIGKQIEEEVAKQAKERQERSPGRPTKSGRTAPTISNRDESKRTDAVAAAASGIGRDTYAKAKAIVESPRVAPGRPAAWQRERSRGASALHVANYPAP